MFPQISNDFVSIVTTQCYKSYHKNCLDKIDPCLNRINTVEFVAPARDKTKKVDERKELPKKQMNRLRKIRCLKVCMAHIVKKGAKAEVEKMVLCAGGGGFVRWFWIG